VRVPGVGVGQYGVPQEFLNQDLEPAPLDLIGITEIADVLGVSRQRAGKLADAPDFPSPVAHPASGRVYTRASVKAFQRRWEPTRSPSAAAHDANSPHQESDDTLMTHRLDRTLPHHTALHLLIYTEPRRCAALDDRTPTRVQRDAQSTSASRTPGAGGHSHYRRRGIL
jgi:hypothetical protein